MRRTSDVSVTDRVESLDCYRPAEIGRLVRRAAVEKAGLAFGPLLTRAMLAGRYKLISGAGRKQLYDRVLDPRETEDIAAEGGEVVGELSARLDASFANRSISSTRVSGDTRSQGRLMLTIIKPSVAAMAVVPKK